MQKKGTEPLRRLDPVAELKKRNDREKQLCVKRGAVKGGVNFET